jgi:hypothetical protein
MLTMEQLQSVKDKVKEVTGIYAWFNDKTESTNVIKFELGFRGVDLINSRQSCVNYDLVLKASGVGDPFNLNLINTESSLFDFFNIEETVKPKRHILNNPLNYIEMYWAKEQGVIEPKTTADNKIEYNYKRYFTLKYCFTNS